MRQKEREREFFRGHKELFVWRCKITLQTLDKHYYFFEQVPANVFRHSWWQKLRLCWNLMNLNTSHCAHRCLSTITCCVSQMLKPKKRWISLFLSLLLSFLVLRDLLNRECMYLLSWGWDFRRFRAFVLFEKSLWEEKQKKMNISSRVTVMSFYIL